MESAKPTAKKFIARIFQRITGSTHEARSLVRVAPRQTGLSLLGPTTTSGAEVTEEGAFALDTVYACIKKIAETIAALPIQVIEKTDTGRNPIDHDLLRLITEQPNPDQIAFDFWEEIISNAASFGRGFALIRRDRTATPQRLDIIHPSQMECSRVDGREFFRVRGTRRVYTSDQVLIISAFRGLSPITQHRETVGLGLSHKKYAARFFGRGGNMSGIISTDARLDDRARETLTESWQASAHGMENSHGTAVLDQGMKYQQISVSPKDAEYVQGGKLNAVQICSIFDVPPSLIHIDSGVKFNNQEQQFIRFVQLTLTPWVKRIEQECKTKLISGLETNRRVKFNMNGLLRGDTAARKDFYHTMLQDGVFSVNEVRALENKNPVDGGDVHLVQVNQYPLPSATAYGEKITQKENPDA